MIFKGAGPLLTTVSLAVSLSNAAVVVNNGNFGQQKYDFIVIGGGTGGNVVANRLTEDPRNQVLVLEAGPTNVGVEVIAVPFLCTDVTPNTPWDWNYTTTAQPGLAGRSIPYPRGHVLGGSSSANYLIYTRGSSEDFDRYAKVSGDNGWSWKNMQQYFRKNEKWGPPVDGHNTTGQYDPKIHSTTGINSVTLSGFPSANDGKIIATSQQLKGEFKFNLDYNSGSPLGLGWLQLTAKGPQRSSSATSYLGVPFINRPNLHLALGVQVSRVLQTGKENGKPALRGVEFRLSSGGPLQRLTATKEVILSAGAIGTPQILLNSGIGNAKELSAFGIKSLINLPDVGENLADHPLGGIAWLANGDSSFDDIIRDPAVEAADMNQWRTTGTGPMVNTISTHLVFGRVSNEVLKNVKQDPASGPNTPHFELLITNGLPFGPFPPSGHFFSMGTVVSQPTSRGTVKLSSSDPFSKPIIDPGLLKSDFDKIVMREAVKTAARFVASPIWSDYIVEVVGPLINGTSDAQIDAYNAGRTATIFHPVGTAKMTKKGAKDGVVDPDLKLKGAVGLRVVDASVFPYIPSAHPQVPVYVFAERVSDLIKADWK